MATRTSPARSSSSSSKPRSGSARSVKGSSGKGASAATSDRDQQPAFVRALRTAWMALATPVGAAVRKAVAEDPSLIGYIEREALDPSVRPVLLVH